MTDFDAPHFVYTIRNAAGTPMYVGMTGNVRRRLREHRRLQVWWRSVASVSVEEYPTQRHAATVELYRIRTAKPLHNRDNYKTWAGSDPQRFLRKCRSRYATALAP